MVVGGCECPHELMLLHAALTGTERQDHHRWFQGYLCGLVAGWVRVLTPASSRERAGLTWWQLAVSARNTRRSSHPHLDLLGRPAEGVPVGSSCGLGEIPSAQHGGDRAVLEGCCARGSGCYGRASRNVIGARLTARLSWDVAGPVLRRRHVSAATSAATVARAAAPE